jgi:hypothetical protein
MFESCAWVLHAMAQEYLGTAKDPIFGLTTAQTSYRLWLWGYESKPSYDDLFEVYARTCLMHPAASYKLDTMWEQIGKFVKKTLSDPKVQERFRKQRADRKLASV